MRNPNPLENFNTGPFMGAQCKLDGPVFNPAFFARLATSCYPLSSWGWYTTLQMQLGMLASCFQKAYAKPSFFISRNDFPIGDNDIPSVLVHIVTTVEPLLFVSYCVPARMAPEQLSQVWGEFEKWVINCHGNYQHKNYG